MDACHQAMPAVDRIGCADLKRNGSAEALFADPNHRIEVKQRLEHQVPSSIRIGQPGIIVDPKVRL